MCSESEKWSSLRACVCVMGREMGELSVVIKLQFDHRVLDREWTEVWHAALILKWLNSSLKASVWVFVHACAVLVRVFPSPFLWDSIPYRGSWQTAVGDFAVAHMHTHAYRNLLTQHSFISHVAIKVPEVTVAAVLSIVGQKRRERDRGRDRSY